MTLKTSLLKGGIVRFQLKRFWWVSGLYALLLFLFVPFSILCEDKDWLLERVSLFPEQVNRFLLNNAAMFILLIGAAVLISICMFRYMQNVRSATLLHALPVKRGELYLSTLLSGFILLAAPILLNGIILFLMSFMGGYFSVLPPLVILDWIGGQLLTGTAVLCFTLCVGVLTGSSVGQVVFTFVLCFLPLGITTLLSVLLDGWLFGFTDAGIDKVMEILLKLTPMYYPQFLLDEPIWWIPVLAGVYILLFAGLGLFLYHKRDVERAGDVAAFSWIRPLFLYGVTACVMLVGSWFVKMLSGNTSAPNVIVMLLFALLGYVAAKALLLKSFRIWPYYKGYVVFAVLVLFLYSAVDFNLFGFGTKVPETAAIDKAYVGYHYMHNWDDDTRFVSGTTEGAVFTDEDSINSVRSLQRGAIAAGEISKKEALEQGLQPVYFVYILDSGREITRAYYMEHKKLFPLFSTDAAKDSMYPNIRVTPERIKYIEYPSGEERIIAGAQKEELLGCLQRDLDELRYEEINQHYPRILEAAGVSVEQMTAEEMKDDLAVYSLCFYVEWEGEERRGIWFNYNKNFTETVNWLTENGYFSKN